jgi:hypothetical protein
MVRQRWVRRGAFCGAQSCTCIWPGVSLRPVFQRMTEQIVVTSVLREMNFKIRSNWSCWGMEVVPHGPHPPEDA